MINPWICPKCSRVWAPFIFECKPCNYSFNSVPEQVKDNSGPYEKKNSSALSGRCTACGAYGNHICTARICW